VKLGEAVGIGPVATSLGATGWVCVAVDGAWLAIDAGPDAEGWQPGHAHADGLTFELWVEGERAVVDYGVSTYESDPGRHETRATASHNTLELGGRDSCEVWGAFRVGRRGRGHVHAVDIRNDSSRAVLEHDGYSWMPGQPRHVRTMELRRGMLSVTDRVRTGPGATAVEAVSRLRLDARSRIRASGTNEVSRAVGRWYARHGDAREAFVLSQHASVGPDKEICWRLGW